jgi:hypothetical protein
MSEENFDRLGPIEFERLCQALLVQRHGVAVEAWGGHRDLGADAFAGGSLRFPDPARLRRGPFVFQAKYVESASQLGARGVSQLLKGLRAERERIAARIANDTWLNPRHYVVMTNVRVPPSRREQVKRVLTPVLPRAQQHLIDGRQLDAMLSATGDDLRTAFPTMLGIRDLTAVLSGVLEKDLVNRSQAFLGSAQDLAPVFLATRAYARALWMLAHHGFVVLTGPPEMGKTSIAKMIAVAQAAAGWDVIDCRGPDDFERALDVRRRQLFVADDVFGSTEYRADPAQRWAAALPYVIRQLDAQHWFAWTSRSAPLREGLRRLHLQDSATDFPAPAEVTVDVSALTMDERAAMLFQHSRHVLLSETARRFIVQHGAAIAAHPSFTPLRAAQFARSVNALVGDGNADPASTIEAAMSGVTSTMRTAFATMDADQHRLLVSMLDADVELSVAVIEEAYERHRRAGGLDGRPVHELLASLEEQVLQRMDPDVRYTWAHPSWRDLVIDRVMADSASRRGFLSRCGIDGIELATSTVGGAGDRHRPFLRTEADWQAFSGNVLHSASAVDVGVHRRLMLVVATMMEGSPQEENGGGRTLVALTADLLDSVRATWDAQASVIPPDVLELYYDLSRFVAPLRPGPRLEPSWQTHADRIAARFSRAAIADYDDAFAFVQIVGRNEPRALAVWGYPDCCVAGLQRVLRELGRREEAGQKLIDAFARTAAWQRRARAISAELLRWRQMADRMGRYAPGLEDSAWVAERLRSTGLQLESLLTEFRVNRPEHQTYEEYLMRVRDEERGEGRVDRNHLDAMFSHLETHEMA